MSNYLYRLARFAFRRRRLVLAVWLAAAIAAIAIAQASGGKTNDTFTIPGTEAQNAAAVLSARLPAFSGGQTTIVFATNGTAKVTDPAAEAAIESAMAELKSIPQVSAVTNPFQSHLVSQDDKIALGQVQWSAPAAGVTDASLGAVTAAMKPVQADGVQVAYNGSVYPGWRTVISEAPELAGLIIAFGILMITFGAFAAAGMPILGAVVGVVTTLMGITAVASVLTIASASTTVALMLGLSCGIDYGLFILSRHRTNLLNGMTPEESVPLAVGTAGGSVVFAAVTVIIALCGLTVVGIPFLTVMGLAAAASVTIALLARRGSPAAAPPTRTPRPAPAGPGSSCATGYSCSSAGSPCSARSPSRRCPSSWACPAAPRSPPATPSARPTISPPKASAPASTGRC
jgi:RND superfamily putative drug exporter